MNIDFERIKKSTDTRRIAIEGSVLVAHQAEFMPWLGFISKAAMGDIYLILDTAQFNKDYFENRNKIRIKNNNGWQWITVPVKNKKSIKYLNEVEIDGVYWKKKMLNAITLSYSKTTYFEKYFYGLKNILQSNIRLISDLNSQIINFAFKQFKIDIPVLRTSELNPKFEINKDGEATELIMDMINTVNADVFVAGANGKAYIDYYKFKEKNRVLVFQTFQHPEYEQPHGRFIPYMSFIDLLFNYGSEKAIEILGKSKYETI